MITGVALYTLPELRSQPPQRQLTGLKETISNHKVQFEKTAAVKPRAFVLPDKQMVYFVPGRARLDILKDIDWIGNLEVGGTVDGHKCVLIAFGVYGGPFAAGRLLWAVFFDDKFVKWVDPIEFAFADESIKFGDFRPLKDAMAAKPFDVVGLKLKVESLKQEQGLQNHRGQGNLGLTVVFAALTWLGPSKAEHKSDRENTELRNRFNASKLELGMSSKEVQHVLKAKPLQLGEYDGGDWQLFGSDIDLSNVNEYYRYANILVLFTDGKLIGIYSGSYAHGGEYGIRWLRESVIFDGEKRKPKFADLPVPK